MATKGKGKTAERAPKGRGRAPAKPPAATGQPVSRQAQRDVMGWLDVARYAGPFVVGLVIYPLLSIFIRDVFSSTFTRVIVSLILVMCTYGFALLAWLESRPRMNEFDRWRASLSVAWLFASALGTMWFGGEHKYLIDTPWSGVLFGVGFLLALWWTIGALPAVAGRGEDHHGQPDTLAEALGLGQSTITSAEHDPSGKRSVYKWYLKGVSPQALRDAAELLAVRLQVPGNGVRVITNLDNVARPSMVVVREDVLRKMSPWPGLSRPGGSITEPCRVGVREDGSIVEVLKHGAKGKSGGRHKLVGGMNGAGKTEGEICEIVEISSRVDVVCVWVDVIKAGQTVADIAPVLARVATTKAEAIELTQGLIAAVKYRANICKTRNWIPSPEMPAVSVNYEEGALLAECLGDDLLAFVSTARSVGIFITYSLQRPSGAVVSTDIRAQFPDRQCYGVDNDDTALMVLPEDIIENGADPARWGQDFPGYQYRTAGDKNQQSMPCRSWAIDPRELRRVIAENALAMCGGRGPEALDVGTARAIGTGWTGLVSGPAYALSHGWSLDDTGKWVVPVPAETDEDEDETGETMSETETGTASGPGETGTGTVVPVTQDRTETKIETRETDTGTGTSGTETNEDGLTMSEREELHREIATVRDEVAAELGPIDPELAEALREAEGVKLADDELPDLELWTGTASGSALSYAERVSLVSAELRGALDQTDGTIEIKIGRFVERLAEHDGWLASQARPALYRLLHKAEDAGHARNLYSGGRWTIERSMPEWLLREAGRLEATEGEDDE